MVSIKEKKVAGFEHIPAALPECGSELRSLPAGVMVGEMIEGSRNSGNL
ncbi:hypothetical protein DET49_104126 [Salegentibacter sp. 24]|nr:hypothetical protein DET49_104126 [Salegentibacter sp. 24]